MKLFKKDSPREDMGPSVIGPPTNVNHDIHVSKNKITGQLEGLPTAWMRQIGNQITKAEQSDNPAAVLQAVKFYNYSMKKKEEPQGFKVFITERDIDEETEAMDKFMKAKGRHQSKDSDISEDGEKLPPPGELPEFSNK